MISEFVRLMSCIYSFISCHLCFTYAFIAGMFNFLFEKSHRSLKWQELSDHMSDISLQHDVIDGMFSFYDISAAKLNIYQVNFIF